MTLRDLPVKTEELHIQALGTIAVLLKQSVPTIPIIVGIGE